MYRMSVFAVAVVSITLLGVSASDAFCKDAACCKELAKNKAASQLCDDFYDASVGVAYTMLTKNGWLRESAGVPYSIFHRSPSTERLAHEQQWSTSMTHSGKRACPYPAASAYGVIMDISSRSNLWEYFQICTPPAEPGLCGQCHDGFKCGEDRREPIKKNESWTYEEFRKVANPIVEKTGTDACAPSHPTSYNEFDTNGLSSRSVRGLLIPQCLQNRDDLEVPSELVVCQALVMQGGIGRWPVYVYDNGGMGKDGKYGEVSSLRIDRYLWCMLGESGNVTASQVIV